MKNYMIKSMLDFKAIKFENKHKMAVCLYEIDKTTSNIIFL